MTTSIYEICIFYLFLKYLYIWFETINKIKKPHIAKKRTYKKLSIESFHQYNMKFDLDIRFI